MRILNGSELASFIKARQEVEVRSIFQSLHIRPKLAIIITVDNPVINLYVKLKEAYGKDIGVEVDIHRVRQDQGKPLFRMLKDSSVDVAIANEETKNISEMALNSDIIITATGSPAVLNSSMVKQKAVVVDAGVASEGGKTVGDVDEDLFERDDLTITPKKGGVGPLTVCALFQNVLLSARRKAKENS